MHKICRTSDLACWQDRTYQKGLFGDNHRLFQHLGCQVGGETIVSAFLASPWCGCRLAPLHVWIRQDFSTVTPDICVLALLNRQTLSPLITVLWILIAPKGTEQALFCWCLIATSWGNMASGSFLIARHTADILVINYTQCTVFLLSLPT